MKKVKVKIPAKINLTLDIVGKENGYHALQSLVASINIYDTVTATKRQDDGVTVRFLSNGVDCEIESSNAYKGAKQYVETFNCNGADILIDSKIPHKAGLGGSSADASGCLLALNKLYKNDQEKITEIANRIGSDCAYMLKGGFAVMNGRGERVDELFIKDKFYLVIILDKNGINTKECFDLYDKENKTYPSKTEVAVKSLKKKEYATFFACLKNDLYPSAKILNGKIGRHISVLKEYGNAVMTGSGSAVYGIYKKRSERNAVYKKLKKRYKGRILKAHTL